MGICSYCYEYAGRDEECFSYDSAKVCKGITGPDHPKRLANKADHDYRKMLRLNAEADEIMAKAQKEADAKRAEARSLFTPLGFPNKRNGDGG